jgi:phosphopantetheinyl transferase
MTGARILLHHARLPARLDRALETRWLAAVPDALAARIRRMREMRDRMATLLGIALLLDCARAAGLDAPLPRFLAFPWGGKPYWPCGPDFSIAHTAVRVGCALAPAGGSVGLDLEQRGSVAGAALRLVTSRCERDLYAAAGLSPDDLWTAKEAVLKAAGASASLAARVGLELESAQLQGTRYRLLRPTLAPDCCSTLAATQSADLALREAHAVQLLEYSV